MNVQISIRGRLYTLRSDEPEEDLESVGRFVDERMKEVSRPGLDEYTIALLAALNIASEYQRSRRSAAERLESLERDVVSIGAIIEAALPPQDAGSPT